jgi:SAM-dependent methyltransferase
MNESPSQPTQAYGAALAAIHDAGFGHIARGAAATLIERLRRRGLRRGTVVELACGSGISSELLVAAGYDIAGFDLSEAMVQHARRRVPDGRFSVCSLYDAEIPECVAVTAVGEGFNYLFDPRAGMDSMRAVIERAHASLVPGGLLMFDFAAPGRALPRLEHNYFEGPGWRVTSETIEHPEKRLLERRITSWTGGVAGGERVHKEHHLLALYDPDEVVAQLSESGFIAELLATYGGLYNFGLGHSAVIAAKHA